MEIPRNQTQGTIKTLKIRQLHEIRRHKWQENMNLSGNQRWNQMLRKDKQFLPRMLHTLWCPLCEEYEKRGINDKRDEDKIKFLEQR